MDLSKELPAKARRKSKVTIKDVAAMAGVSRATVSRVINGTAGVAPEKVAAVRTAIKKTNFQISVSARNLAKGKSEALAVILTEPINELLTDPTFATIFQGILDALTPTPITPILLSASTERELKKSLHLFQRGAADAIIHLSPYTDDTLLYELAATEIPVVLCGQSDFPAVKTFSVIYADDHAAAKTAGDYLLARGTRRAQAILGPENNPATTNRLAGYRESLADCLSEQIIYGDWTKSSGYFAMSALIHEGLDFDTLIAGNDRIAAGALVAAQEAGLQVPKDLKILGFDDHKIARETTPQISTVHQPFYQQGAHAVRLAEEMIDGHPARTEILQTHIIERETT
ncbi:LacI family DNA-binding transcriptional regulator [Arcanobacterium hippocoleae]|uniref:DNA-binding LacI/PurR family transcriptional regulator n=1 Tax=Arcanobacterium hippocoleae TaxID=149017 RepID=A0ABU1T335_9ACTO|nr:LacI family DNA-binding transcriptional regulator [Arcanobacterium hippocoleae]MDR6939650.1 DNA-binding LacI/PurR family transcriptional regulator [Arcanobacterium hippocoleae]